MGSQLTRSSPPCDLGRSSPRFERPVRVGEPQRAAPEPRGQVVERPISGPELICLGPFANMHSAREVQQFLAVASRVGRDGSDLSLVEQVPFVVQGGIADMWIPASARIPPRSSASSANGKSSPAGAARWRPPPRLETTGEWPLRDRAGDHAHELSWRRSHQAAHTGAAKHQPPH
jgi:hypothetical protein